MLQLINAPSVSSTGLYLTFSRQNLRDDHVWQGMEKVARWTAHRNIKLTFFVYPFRSQVAGKDISDRVRILVALGHEIREHPIGALRPFALEVPLPTKG